MGQNPSTHIYNSTQETVKICLVDTKNLETTAIIQADEIWQKDTEDGWNTIIIIPLNGNQNTFSYTLESKRSVIIKRKLGQLILIPSVDNSPKREMDPSISGHWCIQKTDRAGLQEYIRPCFSTGCVVFNESNEPIRVCVTDENRRNTHIVLDHLEHNIVTTPPKTVSIGTSVIDRFWSVPSMFSTDLLVSVLDFNPADQQNLIAKAKYTVNSQMHVNLEKYWIFLRIIKVDGHLTIEQDKLEYDRYSNSENAPYSYLLSKEFIQKFHSLGAGSKVIKTSEGKYDVRKEINDGCCIM
jgi:hypothetical protein